MDYSVLALCCSACPFHVISFTRRIVAEINFNDTKTRVVKLDFFPLGLFPIKAQS